MMAYMQNFVVDIYRDGKKLREQNEGGTRAVRVPFGSEYSIRIHNKHNCRAYAKVFIDGTEVVSGKLILGPHDVVNLERFVIDGDLKTGKKFKFVEASHGDVQDPTAKENGLVEVIFEKEFELPVIHTTGIAHSDPGSILRGATFATNAESIGVCYDTCVNSSPVPCAAVGAASDKGATVEGSLSTQEFVNSNTWFMTCPPVSIKIQMKGPKVEQKVEAPKYAYNPPVPSVMATVMVKDGRPFLMLRGSMGNPIVEAEVTHMDATHVVMKISKSELGLA